MPDGIVLPKASDARDITVLGQRLPVHVRVLPIAIETAPAVFGLGDYDTVTSGAGGVRRVMALAACLACSKALGTLSRQNIRL